jgi:hypothetical protein
MQPDDQMPQSFEIERASWHQRTAFRAWVKNSLSTLALAIPAASFDLIEWKVALTGSGVMILKDLVSSGYEIIFGAERQAFRAK